MIEGHDERQVLADRSAQSLNSVNRTLIHRWWGPRWAAEERWTLVREKCGLQEQQEEEEDREALLKLNLLDMD